MAEDGVAIRRRRECQGCGQRFTTFERVEELPLTVVKRSGTREPFDRQKLIGGVAAACKNRPVDAAHLETLAHEVEDLLREQGGEASSEAVGVAVLERLRLLDDVAYLRFASVYKDFDDLRDFQREVGALAKTTDPKPRS